MSHISFSELKVWNECPHKHKLQYIDKVKVFTSTEYTCFGIAIHETCEKSLLKEITEDQHDEYFENKFKQEISIIKSQTEINEVLVLDMVAQGKAILSELYESIKTYLGEYEVVSTEEPLFERIQKLDFEYDFKGFIDLIIKTPDGKYHIIDWKSCSWGWSQEKKTDPMVTYQLTYYKHFYAQKFNIDPKMIETMALSAIAAGATGLFIEVHPEPQKSKSDAGSILQIDKLHSILEKCLKIRKALL